MPRAAPVARCTLHDELLPANVACKVCDLGRDNMDAAIDPSFNTGQGCAGGEVTGGVDTMDTASVRDTCVSTDAAVTPVRGVTLINEVTRADTDDGTAKGQLVFSVGPVLMLVAMGETDTATGFAVKCECISCLLWGQVD